MPDARSNTIADEPAPAAAPINCAGTHRQGAMIVCRTRPGAEVTLGDITVEADDAGWVVLGQALSPLQILGALIVMGCVALGGGSGKPAQAPVSVKA